MCGTFGLKKRMGFLYNKYMRHVIQFIISERNLRLVYGGGK